MRSTVKPLHSLPYAWDEPTLPPHLTVSAPGGSMATYNLNVIGEGQQLTYENFIYIALTGTFQKSGGNAAAAATEVEGQQLVLDVEGTRVFLSRKSAGKRSQLWRMTSTGMLQHEGSSAPQDPLHPLQTGVRSLGIATDSAMKNSLVLDIAGKRRTLKG